jgi:hypothetical protein
VFLESLVFPPSIPVTNTGTDLRSRTMPTLSSTLSSVLNTIAPPIEKHEGFAIRDVVDFSLKGGNLP